MNSLKPESYEFELVTPAFMGGGGDCQSESIIRPPSLKGQLRRWWRAINWAAAVQVHGDTSKSLEALHQQEGALWGSASGNGGHQSKVLLSLMQKKARLESLKQYSGTSLDYLSYGLLEGDRQAIPSGHTFECNLLCKPSVTAEQRQQIQQALEAFLLLGALGSRTSRSWGSVGDANGLSQKSELRERLDALFAIGHNTPWANTPLLAFTEGSRYVLTPPKQDAKKVQQYLADAYKGYRGKGGKIKVATTEKKAFGMPLKTVSEDRRASPLKMSVQKVNKEFIGVVAFFPGEFHPDHRANLDLVEGFLDEVGAA